MCSGELVVFFSYSHNFMQQQRTGYVFHRTLVARVNVICSRAGHVTFPRVFVKGILEFDTLLVLCTLGRIHSMPKLILIILCTLLLLNTSQ